MTALVTGATGFIGANVVRALLAAGTPTRVLVRRHSVTTNLDGLPVEVFYGDLLDVASLRTALEGCRVLYHVAAHYSLWTPHPDAVYAVNVTGTANLMQAALEVGVDKIVYTSSVATVGTRTDGSPADETLMVAPAEAVGHYKRSKILAEQQVLALCQHGLPAVVVNPAAPVGPWDVKPTPTGRIIVDFLRRSMPAYVDTGLNLIDVRDVAAGHLLAAERGKIGQRYILGCRNMTLQEIFRTLAEVSGVPAPRLRLPYGVALAAGYASELVARCTGRPPRVPLTGVKMARHPMYFTASKAVGDFGLPQSTIAEALRQAVQWFRDHGYV